MAKKTSAIKKKSSKVIRKKSSKALFMGDDPFGTYLDGVSGLTVFERVLTDLAHGSKTISELARDVDSTPQEVVSAVAKAEQLGYVRLEKQGDETTVKLNRPS